jgi:hypothetical protein
MGYVLRGQGQIPPLHCCSGAANNGNKGTNIPALIKKEAKWYLCGTSPADNVKSWMFKVVLRDCSSAQ